VKNYHLISARAGKGFTQSDVATLMGCSKQTIGNWENNKSIPDVVEALKLADFLGKTVEELFSGQKIQENRTKIKSTA
jgi:DNA-binding XRE family transcriptional regulator